MVLESVDVGQRRGGYRAQRLFGEEGLVARDQHIGEGQQPRKNVVVQYLAREVSEKQVALLFVDVEA